MTNQMLEGRNAHKLILFFVFISISLTLNSQSLSGKYCEYDKGKKIANCITFLEDNKFIYEGYCRSGDLGSDYGVGHYEINKNSLDLNFDLTKESYGNYHNIEQKKNASDSISINIKIVDVKNGIIPYSHVDIDLGNGITKTKEARENGIVKFKIKKSSIPKKTSVFSIGYESYEFYLNHNNDYNIVVHLNITHGCNIIDEVWNYKMIKKDNQIILKMKSKEYRKDTLEITGTKLN